MISRRTFLGTSFGAGAALALTPDLLLRAFQPSAGTLIQRAIPSSGEMLPVISYGARAADPAAIKEILRTLLDNGGRVVDVLHGGPAAEDGARAAADELGIEDKFFWTTSVNVTTPVQRGTPGPPQKLDPAALKAQVEEKLARFKVPRIDLVMAPAFADATHLAALREMKKDGRIRYIGVHDLATPPYPPDAAFARLESFMRNEQIDFVGTDYIAGWRGVEEKLLPLAQERKIAFMAYFPFDRGRIFKRAGGTPLPEWAAEFGAKTWAQFFLEYVLSHPAVTVVRTGTTNPAHMLENIGAGIGPLPNEATRKRMAALVDTFPPTPPPGPPKPPQQAPQGPAVALSAAVLERYVGQWKTPSGSSTLTFRREGTTLFLKVNANPEAALTPRSETRLQDPRGPVFEFQVDAAGAVTGVILEQGNPVQRIPLARIR